MHTGGCTSSSPHATTRHKEGSHGVSVLFTFPQHIQFTPSNAPLPHPRAYLQEEGLWEVRKQFPTPGHRNTAPPVPHVPPQRCGGRRTAQRPAIENPSGTGGTLPLSASQPPNPTSPSDADRALPVCRPGWAMEPNTGTKKLPPP